MIQSHRCCQTLNLFSFLLLSFQCKIVCRPFTTPTPPVHHIWAQFELIRVHSSSHLQPSSWPSPPLVSRLHRGVSYTVHIQCCVALLLKVTCYVTLPIEKSTSLKDLCITKKWQRLCSLLSAGGCVRAATGHLKFLSFTKLRASLLC